MQPLASSDQISFSQALQWTLSSIKHSRVSMEAVKMTQCAYNAIIPRGSARRYALTEVMPKALVITGKVGAVLGVIAGGFYLNGTIGHGLIDENSGYAMLSDLDIQRHQARHERSPNIAALEDQALGFIPSVILVAALTVTVVTCLVVTNCACELADDNYKDFRKWEKEQKEIIDEEAGKRN